MRLLDEGHTLDRLHNCGKERMTLPVQGQVLAEKWKEKWPFLLELVVHVFPFDSDLLVQLCECDKSFADTGLQRVLTRFPEQRMALDYIRQTSAFHLV